MKPRTEIGKRGGSAVGDVTMAEFYRICI